MRNINNIKPLKILLIQPLVPHYRIPFFDRLDKLYDIKVLFGRNQKGFCLPERTYIFKVPSIQFKNAEFFFLLADILRFRPNVIVTYGEAKQLTNYLLLIFKHLLPIKLFVWSHGFAHKKMDLPGRLRLLMMKLSDGTLFYTKNCTRHAKTLGLKNIGYLNNTLWVNQAGNKSALGQKIKDLKRSLQIYTHVNGIFISRFSQIKAPDLLLKIMKAVHEKNNEIGFIIIGEGDSKPDFSAYPFIYDLGRVYDDDIKKTVLGLADFLLMPSGVGLSLVECFHNRLPIFCLSNNIEGIHHGVEYFYIQHLKNGYIAKSENELVLTLASMTTKELTEWGEEGYDLVHNQLTMDNMVGNFVRFIHENYS